LALGGTTATDIRIILKTARCGRKGKKIEIRSKSVEKKKGRLPNTTNPGRRAPARRGKGEKREETQATAGCIRKRNHGHTQGTGGGALWGEKKQKWPAVFTWKNAGKGGCLVISLKRKR